MMIMMIADDDDDSNGYVEDAKDDDDDLDNKDDDDDDDDDSDDEGGFNDIAPADAEVDTAMFSPRKPSCMYMLPGLALGGERVRFMALISMSSWTNMCIT